MGHLGLSVYCAECGRVYVKLQPEQVDLSYTCDCGADFCIPAAALQDEVAATKRSIRRIFLWSALMALFVAGMATFAPEARYPLPKVMVLLLFFSMLWYCCGSFAFSVKLMSGPGSYLPFGPLGALIVPIIVVFVLYPIAGPVHFLRMRSWVRRGEARLAELARSPVLPC